MTWWKASNRSSYHVMLVSLKNPTAAPSPTTPLSHPRAVHEIRLRLRDLDAIGPRRAEKQMAALARVTVPVEETGDRAGQKMRALMGNRLPGQGRVLNETGIDRDAVNLVGREARREADRAPLAHVLVQHPDMEDVIVHGRIDEAHDIDEHLGSADRFEIGRIAHRADDPVFQNALPERPGKPDRRKGPFKLSR